MSCGFDLNYWEYDYDFESGYNNIIWFPEKWNIYLHDLAFFK